MDKHEVDRRLEALELKILHQEDVVETLNQLVYQQQKRSMN